MAASLSWDVHANCTNVPIGSEQGPDCTFSWRLESVANKAGYQIAFAYAQPNAPGGSTNPGSEWFRRTTATLGTGTGASRTVTYSKVANNVYDISTPAGPTWRVTGIGQRVTGVRRPDAAAADTTVISYGGATATVSQVVRNGVTTNYARSLSGQTATE